MCPFFSGILWQAIVRGLNQYLVLAWFFISSGADEDNGYSQAFTLPKTKHSQNDIWKSLFLQTFVNIVLAALFIIVE